VGGTFGQTIDWARSVADAPTTSRGGNSLRTNLLMWSPGVGKRDAKETTTISD
jgi:hypothetical protein